MRFHLVAIATTVAILVNAPAVAQSEGSGHGASADPSGLTLPIATNATLSLSATTDTKNASLSATFNLGSGGTGQWSTTWFGSTTVQTPIGQGADYTNVATLDGLSKSTAIEFKLLVVAAKTEFNRQDKTCDRVWRSGQDELIKLGGKDPNAGLLCTLDNINKVIELLKTANSDLEKSINSGPVDDTRVAKLRELAESQKIVLQLESRVDDLSKIMGYKLDDLLIVQGHGKVGYESHRFFDTDSLSPDSRSEKTFDFGMDITKGLFDNSASANFSFRYQRSFDDGTDGKTETQCKDNGSGGLKCASGFIGAPTEKDKELIGVDFRYIGSLFGKFPFGIDPGFTYDARAKEKAFQFPLYLFSDSHGLSGGIRYDWTSDKHESIVGVFASTAFSIIP